MKIAGVPLGSKFIVQVDKPTRYHTVIHPLDREPIHENPIFGAGGLCYPESGDKYLAITQGRTLWTASPAGSQDQYRIGWGLCPSTKAAELASSSEM